MKINLLKFVKSFWASRLVGPGLILISAAGSRQWLILFITLWIRCYTSLLENLYRFSPGLREQEGQIFASGKNTSPVRIASQFVIQCFINEPLSIPPCIFLLLKKVISFQFFGLWILEQVTLSFNTKKKSMVIIILIENWGDR